MKKEASVRRVECPACHQVTELEANERHCEHCGRDLLKFCSKCGARRYGVIGFKPCKGCGNVEGVTLASEPAPTVVPTACGICRIQLQPGAKSCAVCGWIVKLTKRLCPFCTKEVGLTANKCGQCGKAFSLTVERRLSHVMCLACRNTDELDDWAAKYHIPFLFQTERGGKIACFKSAKDAVKTWLKFFCPPGRRYPPDVAANYLVHHDIAPWTFPTLRQAVGFINQFQCSCGERSWGFTALPAVYTMGTTVAVHTVSLTKRFGGWLVERARGARQEWKGLGAKRPERR